MLYSYGVCVHDYRALCARLAAKDSSDDPVTAMPRPTTLPQRLFADDAPPSPSVAVQSPSISVQMRLGRHPGLLKARQRQHNSEDTSHVCVCVWRPLPVCSCMHARIYASIHLHLHTRVHAHLAVSMYGIHARANTHKNARYTARGAVGSRTRKTDRRRLRLRPLVPIQLAQPHPWIQLA